LINSKKLIAYGLDDTYVNFRASGQALLAVVESAVLQHQPVLFYYYGPSWLLGKYDFYQLEEPPFDQAVWDALNATDNPTQATAYPNSNVIIGANTAFANEAPQTIAFLDAYETTNALVSQWLAYMQENEATPAEAAEAFLKATPDVWTQWVSPEVAARVEAALGM
jgi:glycine betaine/proline transport system substrate-binding protein